MRATRHNGRSGKHGVYNPKHNDRKFDIANSEHIDAEREKQNIYDKAVEVVTEKVRAQTQEEDIRLLDQLCNNIVQNPNNSDKAKTITKNVIKLAKEKLRNAANAVIEKVQKTLQEPEVRKANTEQIKKKARTSVLEKLAANKKRVAEENAARKKTKTKYHDRDGQNGEQLPKP